ncbi:MAG: ABC transporter permease [Chloroflexi bacterium]|nr:ABC transporter permease [Chloroflexota bacterium]
MKDDSEQTIVQNPVPRPGRASELRQQGLWQMALARFLRNRLALFGLVLVLALLVMGLFANWIAPQSYDEAHFDEAWQFPSSEHWMGTDAIGRDLWSRIVYGARVSLLVGVFSQMLGVLVGVPLGAIAAMQGRLVDQLIMRLVDVLWSFPRLLLALLIMMLLGSGLGNVLIVLGATSWIPLCRLTRAEVLAQAQREYLVAAQVIGADGQRIFWVHMLPNILGSLVVATTLGIPQAIFVEAGLSFLGLGINPPTPSWGQMVGQSLNYIRYYWHLALFPSLMIGITMLGFAFVGDGLRDALDPRIQL